MRGDADIDTPIDNSTADTWLELVGDEKRLWSLNCDFRYDFPHILTGVEVVGAFTLGYDEYYSSFVPVAKLGLIWTI